jgi:hypothetical protein
MEQGAVPHARMLLDAGRIGLSQWQRYSVIIAAKPDAMSLPSSSRRNARNRYRAAMRQ